MAVGGIADWAALREALADVERLEQRLRDHSDGVGEISRQEILRSVETIEQLLQKAAPGLSVAP